MKLKKLFAAAAALFVGLGAFAQNAKYTELLAKAKDYEGKKQFVYAIGTYYDAIAADLSEASQEAQNKFAALEKAIKDGKPGLGDYDEFEIYDSWVLFCKEYEKYWTEYSPRAFVYTLERDSIDRATKTGNYKLSIAWDWSAKYERIYKAVKEGLKKSWSEDWEAVPEDWPEISVYKAEIKGTWYKDSRGKKYLTGVNDTYLKNGAALFQERCGIVLDEKTYKRLMVYDIVPAALIESAEFGPDQFGTISRNGYVGGLNDIKVKIVDESGNTLVASTRISMMQWKTIISNPNGGNHIYYIFKNISQANMKLIDSGKTKVVLDSAFLEYGNPPNSLVSEKAPEDRTWMKNLPKVKVDLDKFVWLSNKNENVDVVELAGKLAKGIEIKKSLESSMILVEGGTFKMGTDIDEYEYSISSLPSKPVHDVTLSSFKMLDSEVTKSLYAKVYSKESDSNEAQTFREWGSAIAFCNELSIMCGLTPCYTWGEFKNGKITDVKCDFNANGYRLPTEAEWEYAARGGKNNSPFKYSGSDDKKEVSSDNKVVKTKKPNALELYDMTGSLAEWCWDEKYEYTSESESNPAKNSGNAGRHIVRGGTRFDNYAVTRRDSVSIDTGLRIVQSVR